MIKLKDILMEEDFGDVLFGDIPNNKIGSRNVSPNDRMLDTYGADENPYTVKETIEKLMALQGKIYGYDNEPNTQEEDDFFFNLVSWVASTDETYIKDNLSMIKSIKSKYPKILEPKRGMMVYRGINNKLIQDNIFLENAFGRLFKDIDFTDESITYKDVNFDSMEKITIGGGDYLVIPKVKYTPHRWFDSWTTDIVVAYGFNGAGLFVLQTTVDDDFIFTPEAMNIIWTGNKDKGEFETLHASINFKSPVNILVADVPFNRTIIFNKIRNEAHYRLKKSSD